MYKVSLTWNFFFFFLSFSYNYFTAIKGSTCTLGQVHFHVKIYGQVCSQNPKDCLSGQTNTASECLSLYDA